MGLSASQARLLTLTSRQHSIEYKAQKLEAEKLQLANDSDQVYNTYLKNLDAKKIQFKEVSGDGSITYRDANFANLKTLGMLFKVATPNGDVVCNDLNQVKAALLQLNPPVNITAGDTYSVLTSLVSEGLVTLMQVSDDAEEGYSFNATDGTFIMPHPTDETKELFYKIATNGSITTSSTLRSRTAGSTGTGSATTYLVDDYLYNYFKDTSVATSTNIQEVSDEVGLKKAEAQYEADMNKINRKDTQYDTQLSQLETERKAIKEEIETLKTVAKENVDRTFKLFS